MDATKHIGLNLYEVLVVLALMVTLASLSQPILSTILHNQRDETLKTNLKHALLLSKQYAITSHDTLVFCVGHDAKCFKQPITEALLYADTFHDGKLYTRSQLRRSFALPTVKGTLLLRTYPHYRQAILLSAHERLTSDNGTFWFCAHKKRQPTWAVSMNRHGLIHDLTPTANGDIIDAKGNQLAC